MRILIVEDECKIANSIKKGLEQEGYAVDVTYDGESGYDMASTEDYDLIILDVMLPKIDGIALCDKLRNDSNSKPILMLTAKSEVEDKVLGLNKGADDYLTKPFAFSELVARIKALLRRPKREIPKIIKINDLCIDITNFKVKRKNKIIKLTKKEFSLLEYLARNKGKILSKEQIIEHVWDYEADILPNTVEVYIGYLRNKIDKPFPDQPPLIHTIRGFGYKMSNNSK